MGPKKLVHRQTKVFHVESSDDSKSKAKERAFRASLLRIKRNPAAGGKARGRKPRIIYGHGVSAMPCADVIFPRCLMAVRVV